MDYKGIYIIAVNVLTFIVFAVDKEKARKNKWRVPEKVLLGLCAAGGAAGGLAAMYLVKHKTRKWKFKIGVPLLLCAQIGIFLWSMQVM